MRTMGAPRCLRASGCTSRSSQLARVATMSQVTIGGGDSATCGLLPTLMSFMGAGVPHALPSRMGVSGTTTASRPFSSALQRACASSSSCGDHVCWGRLGGGICPAAAAAIGRSGCRCNQHSRWRWRSGCGRIGIHSRRLLRKRAWGGKHAKRCGYRQTFTGHQEFALVAPPTPLSPRESSAAVSILRGDHVVAQNPADMKSEVRKWSQNNLWKTQLRVV